MKTLVWITSILTSLMLLSMLTCGLWLRTHKPDATGISFHVNLGIATVVMSIFLIVITMIYLKKSTI